MERTLVLLKPDCVQRRLIGSVISRFEQKGLRLLGMKLVQASRALSSYSNPVNALCSNLEPAVSESLSLSEISS